MDLDVRHEEGKRYYVPFGTEMAELTYVDLSDQTRDFQHTFVPEEMRHRGVAEELVRHALDDTMGSGRRFIPTCPYVKRFVQRHPEYEKGLVPQEEEHELRHPA